ncbi:MAG: HNH endonuclease [bacterium]|nr:HNH endonuclease [bacterium]
MAYELYKRKKNIEDYFKTWDKASYAALTEELKQEIYAKYLVKCEMLERDSYTCQTENCIVCKNVPEYPKLTMHHIKFQKNGGKNTARNNVTLCNGIHQGYHRAKHALVFADADHLPPHIRGKTFKLKKSDYVNWKKVKGEMKSLRKSLKADAGLKLKWEEVLILMRFLEMRYGEDMV